MDALRISIEPASPVVSRQNGIGLGVEILVQVNDIGFGEPEPYRIASACMHQSSIILRGQLQADQSCAAQRAYPWRVLSQEDRCKAGQCPPIHDFLIDDIGCPQPFLGADTGIIAYPNMKGTPLQHCQILDRQPRKRIDVWIPCRRRHRRERWGGQNDGRRRRLRWERHYRRPLRGERGFRRLDGQWGWGRAAAGTSTQGQQDTQNHDGNHWPYVA